MTPEVGKKYTNGRWTRLILAIHNGWIGYVSLDLHKYYWVNDIMDEEDWTEVAPEKWYNLYKNNGNGLVYLGCSHWPTKQKAIDAAKAINPSNIPVMTVNIP